MEELAGHAEQAVVQEPCKPLRTFNIGVDRGTSGVGAVIFLLPEISGSTITYRWETYHRQMTLKGGGVAHARFENGKHDIRM